MVGIGFLYMALISGIEILLFVSGKIVSKINIILLRSLIILSAIVAIGIMNYDLKIPALNEGGVVFWNVNPVAAWIIGLNIFAYGLIWCYLFYRASLLVNNGHSRSKLLLIATDGLLLGTAVLLLHTSTNELQTSLGHMLFLVSVIITLIFYLLPKRVFKI